MKTTLKRLHITNMTVLSEADLQLSPQLNVIAGENGAGKSHVLKLAYSIIAAGAETGAKLAPEPPTKSALSRAVAEKLIGVFGPDTLGRLATRRRGRERCEVEAAFHDSRLDISFDFASNSKSEVNISKVPKASVPKSPVFLPTRELLSIYPGFVSVYDSHYLEFEETWRDACRLLGAPLARGPREARVRKLLPPLEESMGGSIVLEKSGRFYLKIPGQGSMEMPLVAEGLRKLGMIARLIATGALLEQGYLFWDEPETNLNPRLIKEVARTILNVCNSGIQVFVATHSLFLMREIDILLHSSDEGPTKARFFGLHPADLGYRVEQGDDVDSIGRLDALEEELSQSDRYLKAGGAA